MMGSKPMTSKERRAYALGYRFALRKARRELDEMAKRLDDELCRVDGEMRAAREQVAQRIDDELDGVRTEMQAAREEFHRLRAVEEVIATERDLDAWLN